MIIGRRGRAAIVVAAAVSHLLTVSPLLAQGRGGGAGGAGRGPKRPGTSSVVPTPGQPSPSAVPLASWLDDASRLRQGDAWLGLSFARWAVEGTRVWFAPSAFFMVGLSERVGIGASVPVYHLRDATGATAHGVGDIGIFGKVGVVDPETRRVGVAFAPVVMILDDDTAAATGRRATWAVPVSLEARGSRGRVYGSAGFFSNGTVFVNAAGDVTLTPVIGVGATVGGAFATGDDDITGGTGRRRFDTSGSLFAAATENMTLSVSIGRSFSGDRTLDGGPWVAVGVAFMRSRR